MVTYIATLSSILKQATSKPIFQAAAHRSCQLTVTYTKLKQHNKLFERTQFSAQNIDRLY
jgi:hypothetical protein